MNWKHEAIEKLKDYNAKKQSLTSIPEEIAQLESAVKGIRSASADGSPARGGSSGREDMLLSNICKREELGRSLASAKAWVSQVDTALAVLNQEDRLILDRFYVSSQKGAAERLACDLGVDVKTVYHRKDAALRRFTIALYGAVES